MREGFGLLARAVRAEVAGGLMTERTTDPPEVGAYTTRTIHSTTPTKRSNSPSESRSNTFISASFVAPHQDPGDSTLDHAGGDRALAVAHHPRHRGPPQHLESSLEARHQSANKQSIHEPEALMRNLQSSPLLSPSLLQGSRKYSSEQQQHREQRLIPGLPASPSLSSAIPTGAKEG